MLFAIIDVGSNTIRTVVHDIENQTHREVHNARDFARIISYIETGGNRLSCEGIKRLCAGISKMAGICRRQGCENKNIHCFATASLRNLVNIEEILSSVKKASGIDIEIISGEKEVYYDLIGLMSAVDEDSGIGLDLGGGSCQIFTFKNRETGESISLPTGSLRMYENYKNAENITGEVYNKVTELLKGYNAFKGYDKIYAIGGTARTADAICVKMSASVKKGIVTSENLSMILKADNKDKVREIVMKLNPERADSLFAGCAVLKAICDFVGADGISIVKAGVREGYLYSVLLGKKEMQQICMM